MFDEDAVADALELAYREHLKKSILHEEEIVHDNSISQNLAMVDP